MRRSSPLRAALLLGLLAGGSPAAQAQVPTPAAAVSVRTFTDVKVLPHTPVKAQSRTGTCWAFATTSFLESELMRTGKGEFDLSEMWIVRAMYPIRARHFLALRGDGGWGEGCHNPDYFTILGQVGVVPESVYSGLREGEKTHDHRAMAAGMKGYLDGLIKNAPLSPVWIQGLEGILDAYLGRPVATFTHQGKAITPTAFAKDVLKVNPADYVTVASLGCYPDDKPFRLETADNWMQDDHYLNVPLTDFEALMEHAVDQGFSFAIASDVTESGMSMKNGYALLLDPEAKPDAPGSDEKELAVDAGLRTRLYQNWQTTDDHSMHCVGTATDAKGGRYYKIKNSWGPTGAHKGFFYMSRAYMLTKTFYITLHRDALPAGLKARLGVK